MRGMGQNAYNEMLLHAREANQSPVYIIDPKANAAEWKEKWKQRKKQEGRRKERKLMVGRTVMIVLFCAVLFIVGVYVTLYFVDWERIQGLDPLIS
jgi:hypothetical protein